MIIKIKNFNPFELEYDKTISKVINEIRIEFPKFKIVFNPLDMEGNLFNLLMPELNQTVLIDFPQELVYTLEQNFEINVIDFIKNIEENNNLYFNFYNKIISDEKTIIALRKILMLQWMKLQYN